MIVIGRNGRRRSVYTADDAKSKVTHILSNLTEEERALVEAIGTDFLEHDNSNIMEETIGTIYKYQPVSMEQFLEDPYYLGESCTTIYPAVKHDLISLFNRPYREVVFTGALGVGKSFSISIAVCRILYELSCLESPQKTFGMSPGTEMTIPLISKNLTLAREVLKTAVDDKVRESPYFMTYFAPLIRQDFSLFPHNIRVMVGSYGSDRILGSNCFSAVLDEANFPPKRKAQQIEVGMGQKVKAAHFDLVEKIYRGMVRRIKSRFQKAGGGFPGMVMLGSSAATVESFTERKMRESKDDPDVFVRDHTQWTVKGKQNFCGEVFYVLCSTSSFNSRILSEDEVYDISDEYLDANDAFIMDIPIEFLEDFETNMEEALRDIAGFSTQAISLYIQRQGCILECINKDRVHPFSAVEWVSSARGYVDWKALCVEVERRLPGGYTEIGYKPIRNPDAYRWCHIDTSLSGDSSGFTIAHIERWVEVVRRDSEGKKHVDTAPYYVVDFMLRINPPMGEQIYLPDVRALLYQFLEHGFKFIGMSTDSYQCLNENTLVESGRGLVPISDIKKGDIVETRQGPERVLNVWDFGEKPTLVIETSDGIKIEGTRNHKIEALKGWVLRNKLKPDTFYPFGPRGKSGGVDCVWEWRKLSDIKKGDVIRNVDWESTIDAEYVDMIAPKKMNPGGRGKFSSVELPSVMTEDIAELIGIIWGDGCWSRDTIRISCHISEKDNLADFIESIWGIYPDIKMTGSNASEISISSVRIIRWLEENGIKKEKPLLIPDIIMKSPKSVRAAFLRGIFSADGSVDKRLGNISLSTNSLSMASSIVIMLRSSFNIQGRIIISEKKYEGDFLVGGLQYIVNIRGPRSDFYNKIGFRYMTKSNALLSFTNTKGRVLFAKVKSISESKCKVIDIEVENDHSYIANGIVSHNSAETHQQVKRRGIAPYLLSVDTSVDPYDELKSAFYERRIEIYDYEPFTYEFKKLEYDRLAGKVDHPLAGCFVGDTQVLLADGRVEEIASLNGKSVQVRSFDHSKGVVIGEARGRLTKYTKSFVDVWFIDGNWERCTPEHRWLLSNGEYKQAKELVSYEDKIMSIDENPRHIAMVQQVELDKEIPVYDLSVDVYCNFALASGVFVHNSKDVADSVAGAVFSLRKSAARMPLEERSRMNNGVQNENAWVSRLIPADEIDIETVKDMAESKDVDFLPIIFD